MGDRVVSDLVPLASDPSIIDRAADPGQFVVLACERAKSWLIQAVEVGDIDQIVELKSQAEAIRVYAVQKRISHDAELAAAEVVRRAERGIHRAVECSRDRGELLRPGQTIRRPGHQVHDGHSVKSLADVGVSKEFVKNTRDLAQPSDEEFDEAIDEAKAEGNLTRASVVRKIRGEAKPKGKRHELLHRTRHIDSNRIVEETVALLDGAASGIELIDYAALNTDQLEGWINSLKSSLPKLSRLKTQLLKEMIRAED